MSRFIYLRAGPAAGYASGAWQAMEWSRAWPWPHVYGAALCMVAGAALAIAGAILIWGEK